MYKHYQNEIGTVIQIDTGVDLTDATNAQIEVLRPDHTTVVWTAVIVSIGGSIINPASFNNGIVLSGSGV